MNSQIKNALKQCSFIMVPYRALNRYMWALKKKYWGHYFKKYSLEAMAEIHKALDDFGKSYFLNMGTLLGVYRDGRLIMGDMDIDLGAQIEEEEEMLRLQEYLKDRGFKHLLSFCTDKFGLIQDTFEYKRVRIDINYYWKEGNNDVCYILYGGDKIVKLTCQHIERTKKITFKDIKVSVPDDIERYLEDRYGPTWRTPDPNYVYWEGHGTMKVDGVGECIKCS